MQKKRTVTVIGPNGSFKSRCTSEKANGLIASGRGVFVSKNKIKITETKQQRNAVKQRIISDAGRICYICGKKIPYESTATIDHVIPKSRDYAADRYSNMKCCCVRCNKDKGNMTINEYVVNILLNRQKYSYISNRQITKLMLVADSFRYSPVDNEKKGR